MKTKLSNNGRGAFTLIEVMVTMGLLTFIIVGLLAMFTQTQRAFRGSMTQTDVLESGRSVMELLTRDIEQVMPTRYPDMYFGSAVPVLATNFFVETTSDLVNPLIQDLPGSNPTAARRINFLQRCFFYSKVNQDWIGTGYEVVPGDAKSPIGTLYRFSITNFPRTGPFTFASAAFRNTPASNWSRIADGVIYFRVKPYAPNGFPIFADSVRPGMAFVRTNAMLPVSGALRYAGVRDAFTIFNAAAPEQMYGCYFVHDAVPAYVEVELGLLEPQLYQRYKSIPAQNPEDATSPRTRFLSDHVAQVHIFRQRIPIRNVDVSVYP